MAAAAPDESVVIKSSLRRVLIERVDEDAVDEAVIDYVVASAEDILQERKRQGGSTADTAAAAEALAEELAPLLEDVGAEGEDAALDICTRLANVVLGGGADNTANNGDKSATALTTAAAACEQYALELRGVILAFAGRVLLRSSDVLLVSGRRYGLVGPNGAGKTTLLNKLAAGDFLGFPSSLSVVYIQHEVHDDHGETCVEYLQRMAATEGARADADADADAPSGGVVACEAGEDEEVVRKVLSELGFSRAMQDGGIAELSGGWRMRLAIGRSMLAKATLLLLDEPTNHLDKSAVAWLTNYLRERQGATILFVSHDAPFLEAVSTDIIHLNNTHLDFHRCSFYEFCERVPSFRLHTSLNIETGKEVVDADNTAPGSAASGNGNGHAAADLSRDSSFTTSSSSASTIQASAPQFMVGDAPLTMSFPDPGPLDGIKSRNKVIMKGVNIHYKYPGTDRFVLAGASVRVMLSSRVALMGPNGAGKTTLIKLLIGELNLRDDGRVGIGVGESGNRGEIFRHHNLRVSYIAQHSMHHLGANVEMTPLEYVQNRFYFDEDKEVSAKATMQLTDEEVALSSQRGNVSEVIGRRIHGSQVEYECVKVGRRPGDTVWEPLVCIQYMNPYVMKLCRNYDEKMKWMAARTGLRSLTYDDIQRHLDRYGIRSDLSRSKIKRMSGGQRSRLVIAAAMWTKPHILVLDEPTNFLDNETMLALVEALRTFKGGVLLISHNQDFVDNVSKQKWLVKDGRVEEL